MIHTTDAKACNIEDGETVRVTSRVGSIELNAEISQAIMPGVLCIPHGWGHHRKGMQLNIAQKYPGVSINDITDDQYVDALSGVAVLNGVPVNISKLDPAVS